MYKRKLSKTKLVFLLSVALFIIHYSLFIGRVHAQVPPTNPPVPCNQVRDPEFHSLRPYQASPCSSEVAPYASFCGNNLTLKDTVHAKYPGGGGICKQQGKKIVCKFSVSIDKTITIDLSGANLPIMGNTEEVTNYKGKADQLTDAQKVNEYVSWYLNGVNNRAEYPFLAMNSATDTAKLVNYSGPINKLLPQDIQVDARINTINQAKNTRHDQIVACTIPILGIPIPCYDNRLLSYVLNKERLTSWNGEISSLPTLPTTWNSRTPPQRKDFLDYTAYYKALREWRGQSCGEFTIPIIGTKILLCYDNILRPNYWASLFPYIPFSSTEDKKGGVMIDNVSSATQSSSGITVSSVSFSNQKPADLFFSHMQETDDLASILQDTFVSTDEAQNKAGSPTGVDPAKCDTVDVRSNKGDDLFAGEIVGDLKYNAAFSCEFNPVTPSKIPGPPQTCSKDIYISLSTKSSTPNIENIWSRLVAGPSSVFKRIFPKLGVYIGSIKDIPGSTVINYSGGGVNESADLKLPHIGGISEYFLKGIQTMLRPKGYGEAISFGESSEEPGGKCKKDVPDSAVPAKYLGTFKSNVINLADRWSTKCPGPDNNQAEECYNYVVTESAAKGINPAFTLTIWLNESGASNYCDGGDTTQDFGINLSSLYKNLVGQLNKFVDLPDAFKYCASIPGFIEPMHAFLSRFQSSAGACNPSDPIATQYYKDVRDTTWSWVSGCSTVGIRFGISWPTDNSCP